LNCRIFKENFEFENYFRILEDKDIYTLPIETGRWNNIDRVNRICTKCDNITIGDEYHYIMEREQFSNFRNRFIVTNLRERPNILKFKQIMSAYQKQNLDKLCKFIRNINKSLGCLTPMSLLYICLYLFCICYMYIYVFSVPLYMVYENKDD
jgi:hypothetical protein